MTKEIFVDRSGNQIDPKNLNDYEMIGFRYNEEDDLMVWEYTKRQSPLPVLGWGIILLFILMLCAIVLWYVISFLI